MTRIKFPADAIEELCAIEADLVTKGAEDVLVEMVSVLTNVENGDQAFQKNLKVFTAKLHDKYGFHPYSMELLLLLDCYRFCKKRYDALGLDEEIFWKSAMDMTWKVKECRDVYGVNGIFVGHWYFRFFIPDRFALGRLQFELIEFPFDKFDYVVSEQEIHLKKGDLVINMHIPSECPLTEELAEDAFARAREFFPEQEVFVMDSWLLDPDMMALLPEGHLKDFTSRFQVIHAGKSDVFHDAWRVFHADFDKPAEELPTDTRLQAAIATALKDGMKFGEGFGVLVR